MRNLALLQTSHTVLPDESAISAIAVDLDEDVVYIATEHKTPDADVKVQVRKVTGDEESAADFSVVTSSQFQAYLASNPWATSFGALTELVSFKLLSDTRTFVFVMRGGEIATAPLEDDPAMVEVVGNIDAGILAASWSPDDSLLVLCTGDDKLILMTSTFDVISETAIQREDFGEDAPINVGWGSKQTQFHGSLGKAAAQAPRPAAVGSSPDDDMLPRISWRGDGAYFAVSSLSGSDSQKARALRIYSHTGLLQSTSEPTPGLEHVLSWRPSGNWIVATQRFGFPGGGEGRAGRHDVVMFERNGLRRLEFGIEAEASVEAKGAEEPAARRWAYRVREALWSSDSNILALWIEKDSGDVVQLWTIGNYHWYLKHEIVAPALSNGKPGRYTSVQWHPEDATTMILTTSTELVRRKYAWDTFASHSKPPNDSGTVAVLDGASILLTPFRTQNIPPPMSSHQLSLTSPPADVPHRQSRLPAHLAFSPTGDLMAALWETGYIELTDLRTRLGPGRGKVMEPVKLWAGILKTGADSSAQFEYRQAVVLAHSAGDSKTKASVRVAVLGARVTPGSTDEISVVEIGQGKLTESATITLPHRNGRMVPSDSQVWWQSPEGGLFSVDISTETTLPVSSFRDYCPFAQHLEQSSLFIGMTSSSQLHAADESGASQLVAANANSFTVASGFLVWTSTAHVAHFAPLTALATWLAATSASGPSSQPEWETRKVERGSRIVTAVPSTMSLILQMPRGNLETVHPRPLVMEIVRQDIGSRCYAKAFSACRRHRVDLNVFVDHDEQTFMDQLPAFLEQVDDVDYINLFLTSVGQGTLPDDVVNRLCDGIRGELEKKDIKKYINSILTAHVMKRPPDHEAGLASLIGLRENQPHLVEEAVKYIIFLVDADRLFDTALGMYDFSLVLMVAQHAQKDPREYLPFLRELRALDKFYQRFKIDDHLRRYPKALRNLSFAGEERLAEAFAYVEKHQLYDAALSIWRSTPHHGTMLDIYGDWLFERREFRDAAFVFGQAKRYAKAMLAHEKALEWQELFDIALQQGTPDGDLQATAYRVAEDLSSKKRYQEASRVLLDYAKDAREALIALVQGNHFSEARRVITLYQRPDLLEEIVYPGAHESHTQIAEDLGEMRGQLRKQLARIRELRVKKVEEPDAFYGTEDVDLHNVDVMTDVSMAPTAFTRYTVAPSAMSKASKRSSRSKRKLERKVGSGRKGTVDEEEYLLRSVTKLAARFSASQSEATHLLPHLLQFTAAHHAEALSLQSEIAELASELERAVQEIWSKPAAEDGGATAPEGWAARMAEHERQRRVDPLEKVARPELVKSEWSGRMSEVGANV